jgi:hypothetical protein
VNPVEHRGDAPRERVTLSAEQKQQGFAAVSERLKRYSSKDRDRLLEQANAAVRGYAAYCEGERCLESGDFIMAILWLGFAAGRGIPGAAETLAAAERRAGPHLRALREELRESFDSAADRVLAACDSAVPPEADPPPPRLPGALGLPILYGPRSGDVPRGLSGGRQDTARTGVRKGLPGRGF